MTLRIRAKLQSQHAQQKKPQFKNSTIINKNQYVHSGAKIYGEWTFIVTTHSFEMWTNNSKEFSNFQTKCP